MPLLTIIPIVNIVGVFYWAYTALRIIGKPGWWILLCIVVALIPVANLLFFFYLTWLFARSFDRGFLFTLGLFFLSPIFMAILGFGSAEYIGPQD